MLKLSWEGALGTITIFHNSNPEMGEGGGGGEERERGGREREKVERGGGGRVG